MPNNLNLQTSMKASIIQRFISERALATLAIIVLPLFYFYPAVKGDLALVQGDGWDGYLGYHILIGQAIAQGKLPLWNPYIFGGMPLLAASNPGAFYPLNWVFAILSPGVATNLVAITTYHLALAGAYRYARSLDINRAGAIVTGVAFAFGGFMVTTMGQTAVIGSAAWLPWVLLAIEKLSQRVSWRWIALGAVFIALQFFAGYPQMVCYTVLVAGAYFLFLVLIRDRQRRGRWRFALAVLAMAIFGVLLSAVQMLPLRELQLQSPRAEVSYAFFASFSFPPGRILSLIFPYFFGGATLPPYHHIPYWGQADFSVTCGYVGLLALLLGTVAVIGWRKRSIVWFWAGVVVVSLTLSFGDYLPFGMNHVLHRLPVYNLFRAPFRHMFEFTFACAALAGLGIDYFSRNDWKQSLRTFVASASVMTTVVLFTSVAYLFGARYFTSDSPLPAQSDSLTNPEIIIPLVFFASSLIALWNYARRRTILSGALLVLVLMADLAAYGQSLEWRAYMFSVNDRLADPQTVKYIKAQEPDLNSFRTLGSLGKDYLANTDMLNYSNISIAREIQSACGYDMLRMNRPATVMGEMNPEGMVSYNVFNAMDQGLNLFNVKYALIERPSQIFIKAENDMASEGMRFSERSLNLNFGPGSHYEMAAGGAAATELAIISAMSNSAGLIDGAPVLRFKLHTKDGRIIERELQAGRDTSEWAYDRADVRPIIRHARARVIESWPEKYNGRSFQAHRYLARLSFERAEIEKLEMNYLGSDAAIVIRRASLFDSTTGFSAPLGAFLAPERWRKLASFGEVDLYQNLKAMPRAWFVNKVIGMSSADVLQTIKHGKDPEGQPFDPAETALMDKDALGEYKIALPPSGAKIGAEVSITRYDLQRIELRTRHPQAGFLVLSEVYYPGWIARVDGAEIPIHRVNYTLRGLEVPPGDHEISFVYESPIFRLGAIISGIGAVILLIGACYPRFLVLILKSNG